MEDPDIEEENTENAIILVVKSSRKDALILIRNKLRQQRIRDSARKILLRNMSEEKAIFFLNKQAAFAGRIHLIKNPELEDYLGPITITITSNNIQKIIEWLTSGDDEKKHLKRSK